VFVELPAGLCDKDGEDPQVTAARELQEEAELRAEHWRHLVTLYPSAGLTSEQHHLYLATGLTHADRGDFELRAEEAEMEQLWVPVEELLEAVLSGRVREAPLAAAVLTYDALKRRGRL
jgi:8-oxo-dGTP pyrophosphatase MutT (NUDIX family)